MLIFTDNEGPHLSGVSYNVATTENNGIIWNNRGYTFSSNLPSYLIGTTLLQVPAKEIPIGTIINICVDNPSTIYIANEPHDKYGGRLGVPRDGGFDESLPANGWTLVSDSVEIRTDFFCHVWSKVVSHEGPATITLPETTTQETVHVIFIRPGKFCENYRTMKPIIKC